MSLIAFDTETTGTDLYHGARPFFLTFCVDNTEPIFYEWPVNPLTRKPEIPKSDVKEIRDILDSADELVAHHAKFDIGMLYAIGVYPWGKWPWHKTHDTLPAGHLLASNLPHNLTDMAMMYLGADIEPFEKLLQVATQAARRLCRNHLPKWRIAREGMEDMPSYKGSKSTKKKTSDPQWKYDTWLLKTLWDAKKAPFHPEYADLLGKYSNTDSWTTYRLWLNVRERMERRGLMRIYQTRMKLYPIIHDMEIRGITFNGLRTQELKSQYRTTVKRCKETCYTTSNGKIGDDKNPLPVSGVSGAMKDVIFNHFSLDNVRKTPKGGDSMDKLAVERWMLMMETENPPPAYRFLDALQRYRKRQTALGFIEAYERYQLPMRQRQGPGWSDPLPGWYVLHSSLNPTGTDTLRFTSANPNSQQVSKQIIWEEGQEGNSARYMFGPGPGREWWSLDYENIELRLPAYRAGETDMIALFEHPDAPPFYGSNHALIASILHPKEFWACGDGKKFKEKYKDTLYQWVKNGNFCVQYGGGQTTADRTYHIPGAYVLIKKKFAKMEALNQACIAHARRHGYVETFPDKTVDPVHGYPLTCTRTEFGKVLTTVPLNYVIQGTAMWCTCKAMLRCHEYLDELNQEDPRGWFMAMQVHDEIVFDFPAGGRKNLPKIRRLQMLMSQSGEDIGVPLRVSASWHPDNWGHDTDYHLKEVLAENAV